MPDIRLAVTSRTSPPADVGHHRFGLVDESASYHLTLRMFCDYLLDGRYGWISQCEQRFGRIPSQICHDYNTAAHLVEYEGEAGR